MAGTHVSDITAAGFQKDVVERSMTKPVLLDFWAAWCAPCRTLGPVLEKLATDYAGGFHLGKVDTEKEQDLAYAFGVQGIPFCVLVDGGRPVDGFQGALPEAEVKKFLQRNGIEPVVVDEPPPAAPAPVDPNSPEARLQRGLQAAARGDVAAVRTALEKFPEEDERADRVQRILGGLEWLAADLGKPATPAEVALLAARQGLLAGDHEAAMQQLLDSVAADKGHRGGLARKAMLLCFALVGEDDERLDAYRRRLATLLY
jgi:putative thioredoxin